MSKQSPLEELFSDSGPVDLDQLVMVLKPFVRIHSDSKEIYLTDQGNKCNIKNKMLIYFLAKKLLKLEEFISTESVSAKEIADKLNLKKGSVDATFKTLRESGFIMGSGKEYNIPNYKISDINTVLGAK